MAPLEQNAKTTPVFLGNLSKRELAALNWYGLRVIASLEKAWTGA